MPDETSPSFDSSTIWDTRDINFDKDGKLIIKNPELAKLIDDSLRNRRELTVEFGPVVGLCPVRLCPQGCPEPLGSCPEPGDMCDCVNLKLRIKNWPVEGTGTPPSTPGGSD